MSSSGRRPSEPLGGELEQQSKGVPVGRYGVLACTELLKQPVGEETLNQGLKAGSAHRSPPRLPPAKAFGGKLEEFRNRLDIPVGVADIDMAEISCELWQFAPHVETCTIPFDEPTCRETVTKILQPRPTTDAPASSWYPQTDSTGYPGERATGGTTLQPSAAFGNEKRLVCLVANRVHRAALHSAQARRVLNPRLERSGISRTLSGESQGYHFEDPRQACRETEPPRAGGRWR